MRRAGGGRGSMRRQAGVAQKRAGVPLESTNARELIPRINFGSNASNRGTIRSGIGA